MLVPNPSNLDSIRVECYSYLSRRTCRADMGCVEIGVAQCCVWHCSLLSTGGAPTLIVSFKHRYYSWRIYSTPSVESTTDISLGR